MAKSKSWGRKTQQGGEFPEGSFESGTGTATMFVQNQGSVGPFPVFIPDKRQEWGTSWCFVFPLLEVPASKGSGMMQAVVQNIWFVLFILTFFLFKCILQPVFYCLFCNPLWIKYGKLNSKLSHSMFSKTRRDETSFFLFFCYRIAGGFDYHCFCFYQKKPTHIIWGTRCLFYYCQ